MKLRIVVMLALLALAFTCISSCLAAPAQNKILPEPAPLEENEQTPELSAPAETAPVESGLDLATLTKIESVTLTHYCICEECCGKAPDHPDYGITASGRPAEPYVSVAVDPAVIPMGSTVVIDYGDGDLQVCRADDTGSAINGARVDLCVAGHQEAWDMGKKAVTVYWTGEEIVRHGGQLQFVGAS